MRELKLCILGLLNRKSPRSRFLLHNTGLKRHELAFPVGMLLGMLTLLDHHCIYWMHTDCYREWQVSPLTGHRIRLTRGRTAARTRAPQHTNARVCTNMSLILLKLVHGQNWSQNRFHHRFYCLKKHDSLITTFTNESTRVLISPRG